MDLNSNVVSSVWQHEDQPQGGVFIPPKGEDATMYDMYKSPEEITAAKVAPKQESAAPAYVEEPEDSEPGYILTPSGKSILNCYYILESLCPLKPCHFKLTLQLQKITETTINRL